MNVMLAFGWASLMLLIGFLFRAKIPFLKSMLVPSSVIGGIIGLIIINEVGNMGVSIGLNPDMFNELVSQIFTISFISICLTSTSKNEMNSTRNTAKGIWGLGLVWCILYALTPLIGMGVVALIGKQYNMDLIYGLLIPFAFCQGPGQSATFGAIFEQYGWSYAAMVAITFSAVGFVVAFLIGIPMAKLGIKRGIAKNVKPLDDVILRGYMRKSEQVALMIKDTTCNSNVETLTFHFAIIGLCYLLAAGIGYLFSFIPGFLGTSMSGMMFMNGMYAAYIVKFVMKKLKLDFLLESTLQNKITGWTADYLVICAFMSISIQVIQGWLVPIVGVAIASTVVTFILCFSFGQRFGGVNDFERSLGLYGMCTGTVPTGIALVRLVDPDFKTSTAVELGGCNLVMLLCTPTYMVILAFVSGSIGYPVLLVVLAASVFVLLVVLKITKCWNKKSFDWKQT